MWYQPDMQTGSWHMKWTVHREKGCMTERQPDRERVDGAPHDRAWGWKAERGEERMQMHMSLNGMAWKSWNLVPGGTHLTRWASDQS